MNIPLGITVTAVTSAAVANLSRVGQQLRSIGTAPATIAQTGMTRFEELGTQAARNVTKGLQEAEGAWWKLGSALGMPLTIGGILSVASGVRSLKSAFVDANSEMEVTRTRMASMLRDWNDNEASAKLKAMNVTSFVEKYAGSTPFSTQGVTDAAVAATMYTKDQKGVEMATKLSAKLAAFKGTTDIGWAAQALQSAMNGDTSSLRMSFGIAVSQDQLQQQAMMSGYGNTMQGRFMALKRLIEMRAGVDDSIVRNLSKTGPGAQSNLEDSFLIPLRTMSEPMYQEGVKALVRFNDSMSKFQESPAFTKFMDKAKTFFGDVGKTIGKGAAFLGDNLERIPNILEKYGPALGVITKLVAGVAAVSAVSLGMHGALLLAQTSVAAFTRFLTPMMLLVGNPLLVAGLIALSAALWPTAKSLEFGGKSLDTWLDKTEKWSQKKDWYAFFMQVPQAIEKAMKDVQETVLGKKSFPDLVEEWFGKDSLPSRVRVIVAPIFAGLSKAVDTEMQQLGQRLKSRIQDWLTANPRQAETLTRVASAYQHFSQTVSAGWKLLGEAAGKAMPILDKMAGTLDMLLPKDLGSKGAAYTGLGIGLGLLAFNLGKLALLGPGVGLLGRALLPLGAGVAALAGSVGFPALAAGLTLAAAVFYPFVKNLEVGGKSIDGWMAKLGKMSAQVDWEKLFGYPLKLLENMGKWLMGKGTTGDFDPMQWWKNLIAPDSFLSRIGDILRPIWLGLLRALDNAFPGLKGWFEQHFGKIGTDLQNVFSTVVNVVGPIMQGLLTTIGNVAHDIKPVISELIKFIAQFAGVAWDLAERALAWLAKFTGSRNAQEALRDFSKNLSGLLVGGTIAYGAARAAPVVASTIGAVGSAYTAATGFAAANPALARALMGGALAIAAVTIMATSVKMYTNNVEENLNKNAMWSFISRLAKADGRQTIQTAKSLMGNTTFRTVDDRNANASLLGALGTVLGRDIFTTSYLPKQNLNPNARRQVNDAADAGESVGNEITRQLAALAGQGDLSDDANYALKSIAAAQMKLKALDRAFQKTGVLDEKEFSRLTDVYFRNVGALTQMGYLKNIFPKNLADSLKVFGIDTGYGRVENVAPTFINPRTDPTQDTTQGHGGGSNVYSGPVIMPSGGSGGRAEGGVLPPVTINIHANTKDGVTAEEVAELVDRRVNSTLARVLNGGY